MNTHQLKYILALFVALSVGTAAAQSVNIKFKIGSELLTDINEVTREHVVTPEGPYYLSDISQVTFMVSSPDSTILQRLDEANIVVYLRGRKLTKTRFTPATPPPASKEPTGTSTTSGNAKEADPPGRVVQPRNGPSAGVGIGIGLDYGVFGAKFTAYPQGPVSIFGGIGYNTVEPGFNGGLEINFSPRSHTTGFLSAMYGNNAILVSSNSYYSSKSFYGPSFGMGVKLGSSRHNNFFTFQIIYAVYDSDFINASAEKPRPILFSLGYNFGLK